MMNELAVIEPRSGSPETARQPEAMRTEQYQVIDPIPVLDTARFEQMQRIAVAMASSSMCPESLTKDSRGDLSPKTIVANCFLVVNQAVRWGMDPFAVAQCVSVISGKLCYEGKLIAAVLDAKLGIKLVPKYNEKIGNDLGVEISAVDEDGAVLMNPATQQPLTIEGTVGEWRTSRAGSPWAEAKNHKRMLMYRGCREWARMYRPAIMLGVYAPDELDDLSSAAHSSQARDVTPASRVPPPPPPPTAATPAIEHAPAMTMSEAAPRDPEKELVSAEPQQEREPPEPRHVPPSPPLVPPPPPPAAAVQTPPTPPTEPMSKYEASLKLAFDADAVRKRFAIRAAEAKDEDELATAWEEIVAPVEDQFFPPDRADLDKIYRYRRAELDG